MCLNLPTKILVYYNPPPELDVNFGFAAGKRDAPKGDAPKESR